MSVNLKQISYILLGVTGTSGIVWGINSLVHKNNSNQESSEKCQDTNIPIYDAEGYDKYGYDSDGYDKNGYDSNGYNSRGYDKYGFDKKGFNIYGRDCDGYNRQGFDKEGYNREGIDRFGYSRDRYNAFGVDRAGHCFSYYEEFIPLLKARLKEARIKANAEEYRYALFDLRVILDEALRLLVHHYDGVNESEDSMLTNLKICESKMIIPDKELIDRLHGARIICNSNNHNIKASDSLTHQKVYFVIIQVSDLIKIVEDLLLYKNHSPFRKVLSTQRR